MQVETRLLKNGRLVNRHITATILSDGRILVKGYEIFYFMTVNSQSLPYPIYTTTTTGVNVEFDLIWLEHELRVQITIGDDEPLYCKRDEFDAELLDSLKQIAV